MVTALAVTNLRLAEGAQKDDRMLGAIILAVVIVVAIPVGVMMTGAVAAGLLGWSLESEGRATNAGSEFLDLNK